MLNTVMEDLDIDQADEIMGKIKAIGLPPEMKEDIESLSDAVADLDSDSVSEIVDRLKGNVI